MPAMEMPHTKKSLGQHWLSDKATLEAIVDCAEVQAGDVVLEVGPGPGTLTSCLINRGALVTAVEFDEALAAGLPKALGLGADKTDMLTVVNVDILRFDLTQLTPGYKVVANIPYYLTSNLIRILTENLNPFSIAVILIQKEVAQRAAARPGQMSLLSVGAQYYCDVSLGPVVGAELFTPPPKVDSQVLILRRLVEPRFDDIDAKQFFHVVRAGFSQKRKTLQNALAGGLMISREQAGGLLDQADIARNSRAQMLSLDEWHRLSEAAVTG